MEIKNVTVETSKAYQSRGANYKSYLRLKLPLPGGEAIYELPVSDDFRDNLEKAAALCPAVAKKDDDF